MICNYCKKEKPLIYSSIYTGAVCDKCYATAKRTSDIAKQLKTYEVIEAYESKSGLTELIWRDAFGHIVYRWEYKKRKWAYKKLLSLYDNLLMVRNDKGVVE